MLPRLSEVINVLDEIAPFVLAEKWDNSGLQVGDIDKVIKKILIALDPAVGAVLHASATGADLILNHHPLIFKPVTCIDYNVYPGDVIHEAIKNDIAIVAIHTNLDSARMGINYILAEKFGLVDVSALEQKEYNGEDGYGLGAIGELSEPLSMTSVSKKVKDVLGLEALKVICSNEKDIKRVAVVGGSGGSMVNAAAEKNADLLITGDIGHHDALLAKSCNINVIDAGHYSTERVALTGFYKKLDEIFSRYNMDIMLEMYEEETDPISII